MTQEPVVRREQSGGSPEETIGCARAVAAGNLVLVSGTKPFTEGVVGGEGTPYEQAMAAYRDAVAALEPFGLGVDSVVRTRTYLGHTRDAEDVGRAHREVFGAVRPAATMVVAGGFTEPGVLVEVEIEAFRGDTP